MQQNRVYRGEITHKGACYPAEHPAIIEEALFEEVQSILAANRTERVSRHHQDPSPLTGLLFDADGERLTPSHALKKGVRYRYYVSRFDHGRQDRGPRNAVAGACHRGSDPHQDWCPSGQSGRVDTDLAS